MKTLTVALLLALAACMVADDGVLYEFGAPRLMKGHPSIRMVQEFVRAKVLPPNKHHRKEFAWPSAKVYCRFVFRNDGPATTVKIGFPDICTNREEEDTTPDLMNFHSEVDGQPVGIRYESGESIQGFHVKHVHFGRHQTRVIEDWYEAPLSGGATNTHIKDDLMHIRQFHYVMFSGGSWKGPIGRATVVIDFLGFGSKTLSLRPASEFSRDESGAFGYEHWDQINPSTLVWAGFAKPKLKGHRIEFRRTNFKPTEADDIDLFFRDEIWDKPN
ncbi:MAG: hypothetical protein JSS72_09230 [Armatimonadetes bacterium]|nr:hypothetical protein [Armatimonadota bacterium]